jgi:hypothetical protein
MRPIMLFFEEEGDYDRLLPLDRYPRAALRRIIRGPRKVSGMKRSFLNLLAGLDQLGIPYSTNRYDRIGKSGDLACVNGKPHILRRFPKDIPILFGPCVLNHPCDDPAFLENHNIRQILVASEWMKAMYDTVWPDRSTVWAPGIDTALWRPLQARNTRDIDVLVYNKLRWKKEQFTTELLMPIQSTLEAIGLRTATLTYGSYIEADFMALLMRSKAMVVLSDHETQGFALLQALSCDVPVFALDRGGFWVDESYYPDRIQFKPVTSTPYWDERCGMKFTDWAEFSNNFSAFWEAVCDERYKPRDYIVENLSLAGQAEKYIEFVRQFSCEI